MHAAGPGHGKVVISSYLVANEQRVRRGVAIAFLSAFVQAVVAVGIVGMMAVAAQHDEHGDDRHRRSSWRRAASRWLRRSASICFAQGETVYENSAYVESQATYRSGGLTISGQLLRPKGKGPFPALVYAHGYIDPSYYVSGQGLSREQLWMAARGYVVLHVDYRNHAGSSDDPRSDVQLRLPYAEDVIGAVLALKKQRWVDPDRVALLGRSMGGGVVYNALVAQPGLVKAGVVYAPVSSNTVDNFNRWIRRDPSREGIASEVMRRYGTPERKPKFWAGTSARTYFDRITEPILVHHGTSDDSCPIAWSNTTVRLLKEAGKTVRYHVYKGEEHAFGPQWELSMRRTLQFLERHL